MSAISNVITALRKAQGEVPKAAEMKEILRLLGGLNKDTECETDEFESCAEDDSSEESSDESSDESSEEESSDSEEDEIVAKRKYKKGPRNRGYKLYIKNGGTRSKWANKSDKYKDSYYI